MTDMRDNKVKRIPVSWKQRWRNRMGDRAVQCQVSDRWIEFPEYSAESDGEQWMIVHVMTTGSDERPRRLCELVLAREDIEYALDHVRIKN
jgi:hypothetical protein